MAENTPSQTVFGYDGGRKKDCLIGNEFRAIPVTIYGSRTGAAGETITGPRLWVRGSTPPYYAYPYGIGGEVSSVSGKDVTLVTIADAAHFKANDQVAMFDYSAGTFTAQVLKVASINETTGVITLDTAPTALAADDLLVVVSGADCGVICSGAVADANTCVILEDVAIVEDTDQGTKAFIEGTFVKSEVKGVEWLPLGQTASKTLYNVRNNPVLHLIDIVT